MAEAGLLSSRLRDLAISLLRLTKEKLPFFILSALGCVITVWAQGKGEAIASIERIPIAARFANAFVSYVTYSVKTVWPWDLAVFYPYPGSLPLFKVLLCVCALATVTLSGALESTTPALFVHRLALVSGHACPRHRFGAGG